MTAVTLVTVVVVVTVVTVVTVVILVTVGTVVTVVILVTVLTEVTVLTVVTVVTEAGQKVEGTSFRYNMTYSNFRGNTDGVWPLCDIETIYKSFNIHFQPG